jgi:hypothetical protein
MTNEGSSAMAKAYWITFYRSIRNPDALAAYAKLGAAAIAAGGGRFLARGTPSKVYEAGLAQRTVMIEFDSVVRPPCGGNWYLVQISRIVPTSTGRSWSGIRRPRPATPRFATEPAAR